MKSIFMLCKKVSYQIGESPGFMVNINAGGIAHLNSGTNNFVDFTGSIYIGIAGFRREFDFRKVEVVCFDKSGFKIPNIGEVFEYEVPNFPEDYYFLQSMAIGVINRFFTRESPYRFILLLDNHETDSWFLQVLNDREIKIDSQFINFSGKL